jgi:hypothetical protein
LALTLAIALWQSHSDRGVALSSGPQANTAWARAAALNSSVAAPQDPALDQAVGGSSATDRRENDASTSTALQPHSVTMQDGTVIWQTDRERTGSVPARER